MRAKQSVPTTLLKCWTSEMRSKAEGSAQPPECVTLNASSTASGATSVGRVGTARIAPAALNAAASASVPAGGAFGGFVLAAGAIFERSATGVAMRRRVDEPVVDVITRWGRKARVDRVKESAAVDADASAPRRTRATCRRVAIRDLRVFPSARALGDALARRSG